MPSSMPTSTQLDLARNSLNSQIQSLKNTNPLGYEMANLTLLSLIADNISNVASGGTGGSGTGIVNVANFPATQPISSTDIGTVADTAATSDTGNSSLIGLLKRLLSKLPALVANRIPVDGSGVTQPVSGSVSLADSTAPTQKLAIASDGSIRLGGAQRTTGYILATASGVITAGAIEVGIANIGNAAATVLGVALPPNTSIGWTARQGDTFAAVTYDATGTQLVITTQR